jgi:nucleoid DNA-binding protein
MAVVRRLINSNNRAPDGGKHTKSTLSFRDVEGVEDMLQVLAESCDVPIEEADILVYKVFNAIADILRKGKTVTVAHFGIFAPYSNTALFSSGVTPKRNVTAADIKESSARQYPLYCEVRFRPHIDLQAAVCMEAPVRVSVNNLFDTISLSVSQQSIFTRAGRLLIDQRLAPPDENGMVEKAALLSWQEYVDSLHRSPHGRRVAVGLRRPRAYPSKSICRLIQAASARERQAARRRAIIGDPIPAGAKTGRPPGT